MGDTFFTFCAIQRPAMRLKSVFISLVLAYNNCLGEFSYTARKCCPQGHSLNVGLECVPSTHHWHYLNVTTTGLPNCRFTVEFAEEGVSAYCFDNSFETDSYLMVMCEGSRAGPGRRVPPMNYVRKCCQFNRSYDTSWQSCWGPESRETGSPSAFFNIFVSRSSGGVDINYGMEMCDEKQVLVDFVLHYTQVLRDESEAIVLSVPGRSEMRFNPDDVCLDLTETSDTVVIRACFRAEGVCSPKGDRPCVKKCCPDGYSVVEGNCAKTNVPLPKLEFFRRPNNVVSSLPEPGFSFGSLCGFNSSVLQGENLSLNLHGVLTDGRHFYRDFCVDHSVKASPYAYYMTCLDVTFHESACMITCPTIVFSTSITSCVLLFLSVMLYWCMLNFKNIHSKAMCFYLISLFVGFTFLTILRGIKMKAEEYHNFSKILGYGHHFGSFCTFLWLTVASFSIWMTFGLLDRRARDKTKPVIVVEIAWVLAAIYVFLIITADHFGIVRALSQNMVEEGYYLEDKSHGYFIYLISEGIVIGCDFILIMLTALKCKWAKNNSTLEGKQYQANKEKLKTTFKVLFVHFVNWSFEIILYILEPKTKIWCLLVTTNSLQGVAIFVILIFKKSFFKLLYRKFKKCMCCVTSSKVNSTSVFTT